MPNNHKFKALEKIMEHSSQMKGSRFWGVWTKALGWAK